MRIFIPMCRLLALLALFALFGASTACETTGGGEQLSSMPHNIPQAWEGQAGMPGMMGAQSY